MKPALATQAVQDQGRIAARFAALKASGKKALVAYITAGDPDLETSAKLLAGLPNAGVDVIELSFPFSDPMADGPTIQQANIRAFAAGISVKKVLGMVATFRKTDSSTPIVLMGYYNPVYAFGVENFLAEAKAAGVDGLIVVDLPPEEDSELCDPARRHGINFIRLITPTTDAKRLPTVLHNAGGFLYYVSMAGITGTKAVDTNAVANAINSLRGQTNLPIAVGFGITTPEQAQIIAKTADGAIIGSAIVNRIAANLDAHGKAKAGLVDDVLGYIKTLAQAVHNN